MPTLSSDKNVYPAPPALASTLLELESDHKKNAQIAKPFETGIKNLDAHLAQTLWTAGKVTSIASEGGSSTVRIHISHLSSMNDTLSLSILQLAQHLIATHLSTLVPSVSGNDHNTPSTFIIAPPNTPIASNINNLLHTELMIRSETARIQLLDTVQLMPYFDFVGLSESFSEVSSRLHDLRMGTSKDSSQVKRYVLLVDGLCPVLESTQRRSGLVQANALAASFLRSVTHLSRSHPSLLIIFNLEASRGARGGEELTSAFSSTVENFYFVSPGGMLQKTILAGMDTVVLLHDMVGAGLKSGDLIVEVVKDRVGASLGEWVVCPKSV